MFTEKKVVGKHNFLSQRIYEICVYSSKAYIDLLVQVCNRVVVESFVVDDSGSAVLFLLIIRITEIALIF